MMKKTVICAFLLLPFAGPGEIVDFQATLNPSDLTPVNTGSGLADFTLNTDTSLLTCTYASFSGLAAPATKAQVGFKFQDEPQDPMPTPIALTLSLNPGETSGTFSCDETISAIDVLEILEGNAAVSIFKEEEVINPPPTKEEELPQLEGPLVLTPEPGAATLALGAAASWLALRRAVKERSQP